MESLTKLKFKVYNGETLNNAIVSYKIDGVRAHLVDGQVVSRSGKPLYNLTLDTPIAEVFLGNWETTVSAVRTQNGMPIDKEHIYSLSPLDPRLVIGYYSTITSDEVEILFQQALNKQYEGLVIHTETVLYKVKNTETFDLEVLGVIPGKGKFNGMMGALKTKKGNVGTGFSVLQRKESWAIGDIIEIECMELTPNGQFRHPRFIRRRIDK